MKKILPIFIALFSFVCPKVFPQNFLPNPYNLDFEIGEIGALPKGWIVPNYAVNLSYKAYISNQEPLSGKRCLELSREGDYVENVYGSVMQSIDATPYRGKKIKIRAAIKAEIHSPKGSAHLWVRERFKDEEQTGLFEYMAQNPVVIREWKYYEIEGWISNDALYLNYGLLLFGNGIAWIDDVSIKVLDSTQVYANPPLPLTPRQIEFLSDFAKVYGLIRYFYPSNEAKKINWDNFAFHSVKSILNINSEVERYQLIEQLFRPIAPLLKIVPKNGTKVSFSKPNNALNNVALSWMHSGLPFSSNNPFIKSKIINCYNPTRKAEGIVEQIINVSNFRNKIAKFSIFSRGKLVGYPSKVILAFRFDSSGNNIVDSKIREINTIEYSRWQSFELSASIPSNAVFLRLAIILVGEGEIYFDDAKLFIEGIEENILKNPSFESDKDSRLIFGWKLLEQSEHNGYSATIVKTKPLAGEKALLLMSDTETMIALPAENSALKIALSNGYYAMIPSTIFIDSARTLPYSSIDSLEKEIGHPSFVAEDRISRLVTAIILWNLIQHFSIYLNKDWKPETALEQVLEKSATDSTLPCFLATLGTMLHSVEDNQVRIWHKDLESNTTFPFQWSEFHGKIIITDVGKDISGIRVGDEVIEINGKSIRSVIDSVSAFLSYSNNEWKYLKSLAYIRYNFDEKINLTIKKESGETSKIELKKVANPNDFVEERPAPVSKISDNILYFDLTRIRDNDFKNKLDSLKPVDYYIFDLRGFVLTSEYFLSYFTAQKANSPKWMLPVFTFPNREKISWNKVVSEVKGKALIQPKGLYFLIDERTVGLGEIVAAIVRNYKIGKLVGRSTGGSPSEVATFSIPCNFNLSWSFLKVIGYDGKEIYRDGLPPQIPVNKYLSKETNIYNKDWILLKAIELIEKQSK